MRAQLTSVQESIVADMCRRAVHALGLTQGVAHLEFGYTKDEPVLFEVGVCCCGGHIPQIAHHVSGVNEFVEAMPVWRAACLRAISGRHLAGRRLPLSRICDGRGGEHNDPAALTGDDRVLDVGVRSSERAGFLVTTGETLEEAVERADRGCHDISIRYADGREGHAMELFEFRELVHW